jgi:HEAT repeats
MDDASLSPACARKGVRRLLLVPIILVAGCTTTWVGTTAKSFIGRVRNDPDPNVRYRAYAKLGDLTAYDTPEQRDEAVRLLMDKFENGREPTATRAIICRSLGKLGDKRARPLLIKAVNNPEAVIKIEACRALGKVGQPEDATVLAQVMSVDSLEDARIAAIEGLAELKTTDPRIYQVLVDSMEHDDPAIRLASLDALRKLTGKDHGTDPAVWRRELKPLLTSSEGSAAKNAPGTKNVADAKARTLWPFTSLFGPR